jgi:hypothetical protein
MSENRNVIPVSIALSPDLARWARVKAAQEGKSRSQFVRETLEGARAADGEGEATPREGRGRREVRRVSL